MGKPIRSAPGALPSGGGALASAPVTPLFASIAPVAALPAPG